MGEAWLVLAFKSAPDLTPTHFQSWLISFTRTHQTTRHPWFSSLPALPTSSRE